ncbi:MAG: HAD family phosphatase [Acidobacteriota bacterium]|nr:HAD family phosphatase [Acidobacteriota bacterium]
MPTTRKTINVAVPEAVIFDMDGLMFDSERLYKDAWQSAAAELGFPISDDLYHELIGRGNPEGEAILCERLGDGFPVDLFRERWIERWRETVRTDRVRVKPGLSELLALLESRKIPMAVATSTPRREALLTLGGMTARFAAIVTGDEVARGKPAPDILLVAAVKLGVEPSRCVVLEDSEPGILAARAAGMAVIAVPDIKPPSREVAEQADAVVESLHDVRRLWTQKPDSGA